MRISYASTFGSRVFAETLGSELFTHTAMRRGVIRSFTFFWTNIE
jgi:hypothetical protein